jgi:hypothetical protein
VHGQQIEVLEVETLKEMTENVESMSSKLSEISVPIKIPKAPVRGLYLVKDWSPAVVYTKSKEFLNTVARYNIHKSRMEIKVNNNIRILQSYKINSIIINDALFVPLSSGEKADNGNLYFFKVLSLGELSLLVKHKLTLHTIGSSPLHSNIGTKEEYKTSEKLYYCQKGQKPNKLKKGKKNILKLFGSKKATMEIFADENDLGFRKVRHLISLFNQNNKIIPKMEAGIQ